MTHDNMIPSIASTLSLSPSPRDEEMVANTILAWLRTHPSYDYYTALIADLHGLDCYDIDGTRSLRWNLWRISDACLWPAPYQIKSSNDLLWQFAIIRASVLLNTPSRTRLNRP